MLIGNNNDSQRKGKKEKKKNNNYDAGLDTAIRYIKPNL
jgi:hypothetical protein